MSTYQIALTCLMVYHLDMRKTIAALAITMLLASCTVTESLVVESDGGICSSSDIHVEQFFIDVLEDFSEVLPEDDSSIMDNAMESFGNGLAGMAAVASSSTEKTGENEYLVSFAVDDIDALLSEFGVEEQSLIAMTGNPQSPLAREAELVLHVDIEREACPLGLAPTTSTTAAMLMGDALMVCLMERRNFKAENFALYHPGGALGRQLLARVKDQMCTDIPKVLETTPFKDVIYTVSDKRKGMTLVYNEQDKAVGIITDGDIRRTIQRFDNIKQLCAKDFMTQGFKYIHKDALLTEALELMDVNNITNLAVTESKQSDLVVGIITIHDIIDFR